MVSQVLMRISAERKFADKKAKKSAAEFEIPKPIDWESL
jgi:hypothetical protein